MHQHPHIKNKSCKNVKCIHKNKYKFSKFKATQLNGDNTVLAVSVLMKVSRNYVEK